MWGGAQGGMGWPEKHALQTTGERSRCPGVSPSTGDAVFELAGLAGVGEDVQMEHFAAVIHLGELVISHLPGLGLSPGR